MKRDRGFTLIELLVVMAILTLLVGLGVTVIPMIRRSGEKTAATTFLKALSGALEAYRSDQGAYPPTSLADFPGVGSLANQENLGIESVVVCLNSTKYNGSFDFNETKGGTLENYDGDSTQAQITRFGDKSLWEATDPWGTPYVYFNAQDYARAEELGKVMLSDGTVVKCVPYKDSKLKRFARYSSFQLISAGHDKIFNTEDDVTDFERE